MADPNQPDTYEEIFNARGHLYNEATTSSPAAREAERAALITRMDLAPGQNICDLPAGGGYLADGIYRVFGEEIKIICVEPAERFGAAIHPAFQIIHQPLDSLPLPDASFDRIGSLAGLHHVADRTACYREWHRVLKPGGKIVIADVQEGTGPAGFLNEFVHEHSPGGHVGKFFKPGDFTTDLEKAGFTEVSEELVDVSWRFESTEEMIHFCKILFAVELADHGQVQAAIHRHLGFREDHGATLMNWSLRYAVASF